VYTDMEQWETIRRRVLKEHVSKRQVLCETGMHWRTLEKVLEHATPPGSRAQKARAKPKIMRSDDGLRCERPDRTPGAGAPRSATRIANGCTLGPWKHF